MCTNILYFVFGCMVYLLIISSCIIYKSISIYIYGYVRCAVPMSRVVLYKLYITCHYMGVSWFLNIARPKTIQNYTLYSLPGGRYYYIYNIHYTYKLERVYYNIVCPSQDEKRSLLNLLMRLLSPIYYNILYTYSES